MAVTLPTLDQIERAKRILLIQCVEKIQHWRNRVFQRGIERQNLARHSLADKLRAVMDVDF